MAKQQVEYSIAQKVLEERMRNLEANNTKEHQDIMNELVDFKCVVNKWMDNADNRFASKLTEKIVYSFVGVVLTSVVIALLAVIIRYKI